MRREAARFKDEGMKQLVKMISNVRINVKQFLIRKWLERCYRRHSIAYMQWRLLFSKA